MNREEMISRLNPELEKMLTMAVNLYGSKDTDYTFMGIEFVNTDHGYIFYPGNETNKQFNIHLPVRLSESYPDCLYLLAHESIHNLSPEPAHKKVPVSRLEEGLATHFAQVYMGTSGMGDLWTSSNETYNQAMKDVQELLMNNEKAIKNVRMVQPSISLISPKDFKGITTKDELVTKLCAPLYNL